MKLEFSRQIFEKYSNINFNKNLFFIVPTHGEDFILQNELTYSQPHSDTLYNKCKSPFQFSNVAKYGYGPPEDGFKGDRNM